MSAKGIDVSKWNGAVDFKKVKKAGYDFVIINAGYGRYLSQKDPYFETNYANAKAAGLGVGAYWYSYAATATDARTEAETFAKVIAGKQFDYPIAFDLEHITQNYLPNNVINDMCDAFIGYLEKLGYYVCLYTFTAFLRSHISDVTLSKYDLWLADWAAKPSYNGPIGMWQYSESGKVSGIKGSVDLNVAYKDYPAIIKSKGFNGYPKETPATVSKATPEVKKPAKKGDVNGDGVTDKKDVTLVLDHVKGTKKLSGNKVKMADANGDGKVDVKDVTAIAAEAKKEEPKKAKVYISYTIAYGDTLIGIAKKYNASVIELAEINGIKNVNKIYAGQVIRIPKK